MPYSNETFLISYYVSIQRPCLLKYVLTDILKQVDDCYGRLSCVSNR